MKVKGACGKDQNKYILHLQRASKVISEVPALLKWEQAQMCITERIGFPEDFMGGPTPLPLSTDLSETRWSPTQNTGKSHSRLLC